jgi:hypothetical protein
MRERTTAGGVRVADGGRVHGRPSRARWLAALVVTAAGFADGGPAALAEDVPGSGRVTLLRTPHSGIQPQAVAGTDGSIHLVFFHGEPAAGDVSYARLEPRAQRFTAPVRVNSQPGSAVAIGTIRGAQLALGRGDRVHVAWNGSMKARPQNPNGGTPMLYSRSSPDRASFEPQRDLMRRSSVLDGGGTVAADGAGHVLVAWQARPLGAPAGEVNRRMFVARSDDDGATFDPEVPAVEEDTGACPCCGTRALLTPEGAAYILFRAATSGSDRDMILLSSRDRGRHFQATRAHPWRLNMCPMSSEALAAAGPNSGIVAAWETQGQVFVTRIDPRTGAPNPPVHPRGSGGNRKHPAVAVNSRGEWLVAWAEDTSFQHGGSLAWRVFDPSGKATPEAGRVEGGIPTHSLPTAVALPDNSFVVIH